MATTHTASLSGASTSKKHIKVTANRFAMSVCGLISGKRALSFGKRAKPHRSQAPVGARATLRNSCRLCLFVMLG